MPRGNLSVGFFLTGGHAHEGAEIISLQLLSIAVFVLHRKVFFVFQIRYDSSSERTMALEGLFESRSDFDTMYGIFILRFFLGLWLDGDEQHAGFTPGRVNVGVAPLRLPLPPLQLSGPT